MYTRLIRYLETVVDLPNDKPPRYFGGRSPAELYIELKIPVQLQVSGTLFSDIQKSQPRMVLYRPGWPDLEAPELVDGQKTARLVFVVGAPGQGKSLLLKMWARDVAQAGLEALRQGKESPDEIPLPICISLPELTRVHRHGEEKRADTLRRGIQAGVEAATPNTDDELCRYLAEHAHERRVWLLLDGLDEVVDPRVLDWMLPALQHWACPFVITSRLYNPGLSRWFSEPTVYRLGGFNGDQINTFLGRWFKDEEQRRAAQDLLRRCPRLRDLITSPFLLTLLCWRLERGDVSGDMSRADLYGRTLRDLLGLPPSGPPVVDEHRAERLLSLLSEAALMSYEQGASLREAISHCIAARRPTPFGMSASDALKLTDEQRGRTSAVQQYHLP